MGTTVSIMLLLLLSITLLLLVLAIDVELLPLLIKVVDEALRASSISNRCEGDICAISNNRCALSNLLADLLRE